MDNNEENARAAAREVRKKLNGEGYDIRLVDASDFNTIPAIKPTPLGKER